MTEEILYSLAGLFSLQSVIGFCTGVLSTMLFYYFQDKAAEKTFSKDRCEARDRRRRESKFHQIITHPLLLLWTFLFVLAAFLGFQQYTTSNNVRILAEETRACQVDFNQAIRVRSEINSQNDLLNRRIVISIEKYLYARLNPPPEVNALKLNDEDWQHDPRTLQWELGVNRVFYDEMLAIKSEKVRTEHERAMNPLPEPSCGK